MTQQNRDIPRHRPLDGLSGSSARSAWSVIRQAALFQWSQINPWGALLCLPLVVAWLFVSVHLGKPRWAVLAIAGAFSAGFGAFQQLGKSHLRPMLLALVGIAVATWIGSASNYEAWYIKVMSVAVLALLYGAMTIVGYATWWIGLQWMIALMVYGARPASPIVAAHDAAGVLAGGLTQLVWVSVLRPFARSWFPHQRQPPFNTDIPPFKAVWKSLDLRQPVGRYALRVMTGITFGTLVDHFWGLANGYWTPMTIAILLRPDFKDATIRGINRTVGTIAGAGLMTCIIAFARPNAWEHGLLLVLAIWGCYTLQRVNYALLVLCITSYVVLLFATMGLPPPIVAWHRVEATFLGAAIALFISLLPMHDALEQNN